MAYSLIQGDLEPDMPIVVGPGAALSAMPTASEVQLRWKKPDGTVSLVALDVDDPVTGACHRTWIAGDTNEIGLHQGQVVVTDANGNNETWPADGTHVQWYVYAQLTPSTP